MSFAKMKFCSSMEKCFLHEKIEQKKELKEISMLRNERLSFQLAYCGEAEGRTIIEWHVSGVLAPYVTLAKISQVPVFFNPAPDANYLSSATALYPDVLLPVKQGEPLIAMKDQLRSVLFTLEDVNGLPKGKYPLCLTLQCGEETQTLVLQITVIDAFLPAQKLIHTQWFHNDCIATLYGCEVFSPRHWELIGNYMEAAVRCGVNMLLTPVLTPPLDTAIGFERPTVQLVDITLKDGQYFFGFDNLRRYIRLAQEKGIRYFEISHLFSQWGAKHAPKVMAKVDGEMRKIFGWETEATSKEYTAFIRAFVTALLKELKALKVDQNCVFHISDEPHMEHRPNYVAAKETVADLLQGYTLMDALSSYEFYETGAVQKPIPCTNHIEPFLAHQVPDLWTYYCCGQDQDVSNRFVTMPGVRTRILGLQLYKFAIQGFLQWGFNFWYSCGSRNALNPYLDLSGDNWVPAGDTCSVYPGFDGKPVYSLHAVLFYEALQDQRALQLLEEKIGREKVEALLEEVGTLTFSEYPKEEEPILALREKVNALLG